MLPGLVRARAWWFNKVPLSVTLMLLLLDGGPLGLSGLLALALVVLTVCAAGNYGYALNDLYDVEEDARAMRANAVGSIGARRTRLIVVASGVAALLFASAAAGAWGAGLTIVELLLPLAYSVPPVRLKERTWLGIAADALAAHVYPAALALLTVSHLAPGRVTSGGTACVLVWSLAAGIRGILTHQLHWADRDRQAALTTVVHDVGRAPLERFIVAILLPIEAAAFIGAAAICSTGPILWAAGGIYLALDAIRTLRHGFTVTSLRREGQRYLPLVEESFYKSWGPIVIALDAARVDPTFLLLIPINAWMFRPHLVEEAQRLRLVARVLRSALDEAG